MVSSARAILSLIAFIFHIFSKLCTSQSKAQISLKFLHVTFYCFLILSILPTKADIPKSKGKTSLKFALNITLNVMDI